LRRKNIKNTMYAMMKTQTLPGCFLLLAALAATASSAAAGTATFTATGDSLITSTAAHSLKVTELQQLHAEMYP
jgi:hypothetical protein